MYVSRKLSNLRTKIKIKNTAKIDYKTGYSLYARAGDLVNRIIKIPTHTVRRIY